MTKNIGIIGSGFWWLSAAIILAKQWHQITVFEKNEQLGGRASVREQDGFRFDMGPSRYLMPDAFQMFFDTIGEKVEDYLDLHKLSPSYRVIFSHNDTSKKIQTLDIYDDIEKNRPYFEQLEPGSTDKLHEYCAKAEYQYKIAMKDFVPKNYDSIFDFLNRRMATEWAKLHVFSNMKKYAARYFKSPEMQKIVQYPLVFLGTAPQDAPALYNIMTYVDFGMGVRYPQWGIYEIIKALVTIATKHGVVFHTNTEVQHIPVQDGKAQGVQLMDGTSYSFDAVISNADMQWSETKLLDTQRQTYPEKYWTDKVMAPSGFILYLGIKGKVKNLQHHTLIFAEDWDKNFGQIFKSKIPPTDPSLYICCPSKTDPTVADAADENIFVLVPFPPGITLTDGETQKYRDKVLQLIEKEIGEQFQDRIVVERIFQNKDFSERYHAFQGTALWLAHTIRQTAIFRPNNISKKVDNLYYVWWYTNPGIGMPMCLISGILVAERFQKN